MDHFSKIVQPRAAVARKLACIFAKGKVDCQAESVLIHTMEEVVHLRHHPIAELW
jgi:hypothetical protein